PSFGSWVLGQPSIQELLDGTGAGAKRLRMSEWCYDGENGAPDGACPGVVRTHPQPTALKQLADNGKYLTATLTYDPHGNKLAATDPLGRATTAAYDPTHGVYPTSLCNPLKQCTTTQWNMAQGQALSITDANNQTTSFETDALGQ